LNYNNAFSYYVGWRTAQQASLLLTEIDQTVHGLTALGWRPTQNRKLLDKQALYFLPQLLFLYFRFAWAHIYLITPKQKWNDEGQRAVLCLSLCAIIPGSSASLAESIG
jgi:hypothetical protein